MVVDISMRVPVVDVLAFVLVAVADVLVLVVVIIVLVVLVLVIVLVMLEDMLALEVVVVMSHPLHVLSH